MTMTMTDAAIGTELEEPSYISATAPISRPRCSLKHGDTFIVVDTHGDIGATPGGSDGVFTTTPGFSHAWNFG
jgi:hypothetical protein